REPAGPRGPGDARPGTAAPPQTPGPRRAPDSPAAPLPNLLRHLFTDPRARAAFPEWERVADAQVARFTTDVLPGDPHAAALADELTVTAGAPFARRFAGAPALPDAAEVVRLVHPEAGELRLAQEPLALPDGDEQRLLVLLPADDATAEALDGLLRRGPGTLRVVSG
ncbi:transcriptional regulator, partial [Streptomyces sp. JJ36]|nr:transcriptional regulator [Streptomyces sp. JJ36]